MIGLFYFLFGLVIGSFLNVLVYRLPRELSVSKGYSFCPSCEHRLYPKDLVPLFSWLFLGRRCRYCKEPIPWRYPAVELANALLWLGLYLCYGFCVSSIAFCLAASCLLVVMLVDWEHQIIPDSLHVGLLIAGLIWAFSGESTLRWLDRGIGFLLISSVFLFIVIASGGRAMGGGDVKLMAALGFLLGWKQVCLITLLGSLGGTVVVLVQSRLKEKLRGKQVPFGSFLSGAALLCLFVGEQLVGWYLALAGF